MIFSAGCHRSILVVALRIMRPVLALCAPARRWLFIRSILTTLILKTTDLVDGDKCGSILARSSIRSASQMPTNDDGDPQWWYIAIGIDTRELATETRNAQIICQINKRRTESMPDRGRYSS
jgi:hypothetical protein